MININLKFLMLVACASVVVLISCSKDEEVLSVVYSDPVTDIDGNVYKTVTIGSQTWMAENLRTSTYADSTPISLVTDSIKWSDLGDNNSDKAYCFYENDENLGFGALYTYAAATNGDTSELEVQGVCPDGWHLPSVREWSKLISYVYNDGHEEKVHAALEATNGWMFDEGTDDYGFAALASGYRNDSSGVFIGARSICLWWSSNNRTGGKACCYINYSVHFPYSTNIYKYNKSCGLSVRCVKD